MTNNTETNHTVVTTPSLSHTKATPHEIKFQSDIINSENTFSEKHTSAIRIYERKIATLTSKPKITVSIRFQNFLTVKIWNTEMQSPVYSSTKINYRIILHKIFEGGFRVKISKLRARKHVTTSSSWVIPRSKLEYNGAITGAGGRLHMSKYWKSQYVSLAI